MKCDPDPTCKLFGPLPKDRGMLSKQAILSPSVSYLCSWRPTPGSQGTHEHLHFLDPCETVPQGRGRMEAWRSWSGILQRCPYLWENFQSLSRKQVCAAGKEAGSGERHPREKVASAKGQRQESRANRSSKGVCFPSSDCSSQEDVIRNASLLVLSLKRTSHLT